MLSHYATCAYSWMSRPGRFRRSTGSDYAMLRARATAIGPWENWYTASDPCDGCYTYFYNGANGLYASAEIGYTGTRYGALRARASSIGPWEQYYW
jgi:hypothetical protein